MKKELLLKIIVSAMLIMLVAPVAAQVSRISQCGAYIGKESIIRDWQGGWSVVYVKSADTVGHFGLVDPAHNTIKTASIPNNILITDFRIHNDSVFFCGTRPTGMFGMNDGYVGCFGINSLFASTDIMHYYQLTPTYPNGIHKITVPRRMDTYNLDGITHIVLVGESELYPAPGLYHRTTLCDIKCQTTNGWPYNYYYNKDGDEYYTDIVANKEYVVAVARDTLFRKVYVDVFKANGDFVHSPLVSNSTFVLTGEPPIGDIRVEELAIDKFVVAYQYKDMSQAGSTIKIVTIDATTPTINITDSYTTPHVTAAAANSGWEAKQLVMDASSNMLYFLQNTNTTNVPTNESILCKYDLSTLATGIESFLYLPGYDWNRMDIASDADFLEIGKGITDGLALVKHSFGCATVVGCFTPDTLYYNPTITILSTERRNEFNYSYSLIISSSSTPFLEHNLEVICEQ